MPIDPRARVFCIVAVVAPVAAAALSGFIGAGPSYASAIVLEPMPQLPVIPPSQATPATAGLDVIGSPFWFDSEGAVVPVLMPPDRSVVPRPAPDPTFTLTTVMPSPVRPLAVINGKPRQIGDVVEPGWTLTAIDGNARRVVLTHLSGRTLTVGMATQTP